MLQLEVLSKLLLQKMKHLLTNQNYEFNRDGIIER